MKGSVEFYERDGDWKEMWARAEYTFLEKEYKSDFPVLRIQQDDISQIPFRTQDHGLAYIQGDVPFRRAKYTLAGQDWSSNTPAVGIPIPKQQEISLLNRKELLFRAGPQIRCMSTLDTATLELSIDVFLVLVEKGDGPLLGHGDGDMKEEVTVQFSEDGPAQGEVRFYLRNGFELWATWEYVLDGETYRDTELVFHFHNGEEGYYQSPQTREFDVTPSQLRYTDTFNIGSFSISVDGRIIDGVRFESKKDGALECKVVFYCKNLRAIWAESRALLNGRDFRNNVPVLGSTACPGSAEP